MAPRHPSSPTCTRTAAGFYVSCHQLVRVPPQTSSGGFAKKKTLLLAHFMLLPLQLSFKAPPLFSHVRFLVILPIVFSLSCVRTLLAFVAAPGFRTNYCPMPLLAPVLVNMCLPIFRAPIPCFALPASSSSPLRRSVCRVLRCVALPHLAFPHLYTRSSPDSVCHATRVSFVLALVVGFLLLMLLRLPTGLLVRSSLLFSRFLAPLCCATCPFALFCLLVFLHVQLFCHSLPVQTLRLIACAAVVGSKHVPPNVPVLASSASRHPHTPAVGVAPCRDVPRSAGWCRPQDNYRVNASEQITPPRRRSAARLPSSMYYIRATPQVIDTTSNNPRIRFFKKI